jgi:hypothetical protein
MGIYEVKYKYNLCFSTAVKQMVQYQSDIKQELLDSVR